MRVESLLLVMLAPWLLNPVNARAQTPAAIFNYRPAVGARIQMIWRSRFDLVYVGFRELPDSTAASVTSLVSITTRVLESDDSSSTVRVRVDSVRSRLAREGKATRVLNFSDVSGSSSDAILSSRLAVLEEKPLTGVSKVRVGRAIAGDVWLEFLDQGPGAGAAGGDSLIVNAEFPFTSRISGDTSQVFDAVLHGFMRMRLDSTAVRGSDTLAYIYIAGPLTRVTRSSAPEADGVRQSLAGSLKARMIWSTAWGGFVSAAVAARFVLEQNVSPDPSETPRTLIADLVASGRIRP